MHHIIFKSNSKSMKDCKLNHIYLCSFHHRDQRQGVHFNEMLDLKFRWKLQNKLEVLFNKQYLTREEIQSCLEINDKATNSLCKSMQQRKGVFAREDILVAIMGQMVTEEEVKELNESYGNF